MTRDPEPTLLSRFEPPSCLCSSPCVTPKRVRMGSHSDLLQSTAQRRRPGSPRPRDQPNFSIQSHRKKHTTNHTRPNFSSPKRFRVTESSAAPSLSPHPESSAIRLG